MTTEYRSRCGFEIRRSFAPAPSTLGSDETRVGADASALVTVTALFRLQVANNLRGEIVAYGHVLLTALATRVVAHTA